MKVLVVDDQKEVLGFFQDVLKQHGYDVLAASNGEQALRTYREHRPSFTITDITMPGMSGLDLLRQIKALNAEAAVMLMTGAGSEQYAIEALRCGAVNYFNKPLDINELINTLNRYSSLAAGYDFEHYAAEFLIGEQLRLELRNDIGQVNQAVQMIVNHCRATFPLSDIFTLRFGLYEMLVNAIEHGNLGIGYEEKSLALEQNRLAELIEQRAAQKPYCDRRVQVRCDISPRGFECHIADQGEGFDHSVYSSVEDAGALFEQLGTSLHGRGILLTRLQFDEVCFNDKGNAVRILKRTPVGGDDK